MPVPWQRHRAALAALGHAEEVLVSVGPGEWGGGAEGACRDLVPLELSSLVMCVHPVLCALGLSWLFIHCCDQGNQ